MKLPIHTPTPSDYERLLAFRSIICAAGYRPIKQWRGGEQTDTGAVTFLRPEYDAATVAFFKAAGEAIWSDFDYAPADASQLLADYDLVRAASLDQIRTMLTYCVRGERFCSGHWGAMIESGDICRLLERLGELYEAVRRQEDP